MDMCNLTVRVPYMRRENFIEYCHCINDIAERMQTKFNANKQIYKLCIVSCNIQERQHAARAGMYTERQKKLITF